MSDTDHPRPKKAIAPDVVKTEKELTPGQRVTESKADGNCIAQ
jgi:hypothetical protein